MVISQFKPLYIFTIFVLSINFNIIFALSQFSKWPLSPKCLLTEIYYAFIVLLSKVHIHPTVIFLVNPASVVHIHFNILQVRGVAIDDFLRYQQDLIETFESGFCGYRGLTGK
jgi:hypothetical protein